MSNLDIDLISIDEACAILGGISKATYWRGAGKRWPKPIKLGPFIARASRRELLEYVERMKAERAA